MRLTSGAQLGPYRIAALIEAGGMGEVYRAADIRLNRTVAIKVLSSRIAGDAVRRERFEREARTLSRLNHPHICVLYDVGRQDDVDFIVMEYLEGESLEERLAKRVLPLDEVLRHTVDIADALDAAHRQGVFHGDLKPANVMLTPAGAKLLDFGLATWQAARDANVESSARAVGSSVAVDEQGVGSPSATLIEPGAIVGSLPYMAPEQLEGEEADERTDIFAFGAVVYEMVTGRRAFPGATRMHTMAAILDDQPPPIRTLQPLTPHALERAVHKCLAKDPEARWQTARDLADELRWIGQMDHPTANRIARRRWATGRPIGILAAVLAAVVGVVSLSSLSAWRAREAPRTVRFLVTPPEGTTFNEGAGFAAVSPDGHSLAFAASTADGTRLLWIRALDALQARPLAGTEGGNQPFWSSDGRALGFVARGKLKRVAISGGPAVTLCDAPSPQGASWSKADLSLFSSDVGTRGLDRIAASGGAVTPVTALDRSVGETVHGWPEFLPDGRHYLFRVKSDQATHAGVYAGSLDSAERTRILSDDTNAVFVEPDYLVFRRDGVLVAQRFDIATLALTGEAIRVADGVQYSRVNGRGVFSASREGVLAYRTSVETTLVWIDRTGHRVRTIGGASTYMDPELSPDGTRVAVVRRDLQIGTPDVWLIDLADGAARRFTFEPASDVQPLWSPDGRQIVFASDREGFFDLYRKAVDGSHTEAVLFRSSNHKFPLDWSRDGRYIVYSQTITGSSPAGLWFLPLAGGSPIGGRWPHAETRQARISPDGRWLAYVLGGADNQLYVRPFDSDARGVKIATGGIEPQWRSDGTELFYIAPDQKLMSVPVTFQPTFRAGTPRALFETTASSFASNVTGRNQYAVSADGQRFLFNVSTAESSAPITVVVDWRTAVAPTR